MVTPRKLEGYKEGVFLLDLRKEIDQWYADQPRGTASYGAYMQEVTHKVDIILKRIMEQ